MNLRQSTCLSLLLLAGCQNAPQSETRQVSGREMTMGKVAPTEVATWKKVGSSNIPDERYLHSAVFDETRKVMVVFGGMVSTYGSTPVASQEIWEWVPATGLWKNRTPALIKPSARSGAGMAFDSTRNKVIIFGGRAGSGYNLEDTWEWDPTSGQFTERTNAGTRPSGRSQPAMVFEPSTGKILLFGGGRSDINYMEGWTVSLSLGDTWEWDAKTSAWTQINPGTAPAPRHDASLVWDAKRSRAILFGGLSVENTGVTGSAKQDTWEWNPETSAWSERTAEGNKPSARYAHAMAFDGGTGKVILTAGFDIGTGGNLADVWEWDGTSGLWDMKIAGTETGIPLGRMYGTLVADTASNQQILFGGMRTMDSTGSGGVIVGPFPGGMWNSSAAKDIWQYYPSKAAFVDRTAPLDSPGPRTNHAQAYCPESGKTYVFGGADELYVMKNDTWEWNGEKWAPITTTNAPSPRMDAAMAYDPARKSLILYGGQTQDAIIIGPDYSPALSDTWEFNCVSKNWSQVKAIGGIDPLYAHGMVTDTGRGKILLFAGMSNFSKREFYDGGIVYKDPMRRDVWEWDGKASTWTNRTPNLTSMAPNPRQYPILSFDGVRQKLVVFDGNMSSGMASNSVFWEWDTTSAGWAMRDSGDYLDFGSSYLMAYDSNRRRHVIFTDAISPISSSLSAETWEMEAANPTWYVRTLANSPLGRQQTIMTFDSARGVMVLFGGAVFGMTTAETWEYKVTNLVNGAGCTVASAAACASGNCVDGVCCGSAACSGPCQSCAVAGFEGSCVQAAAGTEVAGSCSDGQACDGLGACKTKNGQACKSGADCASNACVDGVCCENACNGKCVACNQAGKAGKCTPYVAGTDPQNECGQGTGSCKSSCDGIGNCGYPQWGTTCGNCQICDGFGSCFQSSAYCAGTGGAIVRTGGMIPPPMGGTIYTGGIISSGGVRTGGFISSTGGSPYTGGVLPLTGGIRSGGGSPITGGYLPLTGGARTGGIGPTTGGYPIGSGGARSGGSGPSTGGNIGGGVRTGSNTVGTGGEMFGTGGFRVEPISTGQLHRSGCYCELGQSSGSGPGLPFALIGLGLVAQGLRRRRRR